MFSIFFSKKKKKNAISPFLSSKNFLFFISLEKEVLSEALESRILLTISVFSLKKKKKKNLFSS
jgi:hypothetical protein